MPACIARPTQTEGPYFVDEMLLRSDIRSDPTDGRVEEGIALHLTFRVSMAREATCSPLGDALVDIWHCNASGVYSDIAQENAAFDSKGKKFLRGALRTDRQGLATFTTIVPGWYPGRTTHVHFKIRVPAGAGSVHEFTSQMYFDDTLIHRIYARAPYSARGQRDRTNAQDGIFRGGGDKLLLSVVPAGEGYAADFPIGLQIA
jgi:protocatechuate 3,4-dioxygenase beta subunit